MNTTNIIQTVAEGMEIIEGTHASTPEVAERAGQREAKSRTARGFAYECVGVVAREVESQRMAWNNVETQIADYHYEISKHPAYCPVLIPKG